MPVCYNHASMMICKKIISTITAAAAAVALFTVSVPVALAGSDNASRKAITSSRSFPKMNTARKDLLKETVSVSSDDSESWGGVESLNVPETKSTAEKKAEEEAKKAEEAEEVAELEDAVEELPEEPAKAEEPAAEPVKAEEKAEVKVCKACGKPLEEGVVFCTNCGTKIEDDKATEEN